MYFMLNALLCASSEDSLYDDGVYTAPSECQGQARHCWMEREKGASHDVKQHLLKSYTVTQCVLPLCTRCKINKLHA